MNKKNTYALIVIFTILLAGFSYQKYNGLKLEREFKEGRKLVNIAQDTEISIIEIKKQDAITRLEKNNGQWVVASLGGYPVEPDLINDITNVITNASILSVATDSLDEAEKYGLRENQRIEITAKNSSATIGKIIVGKKGEVPGNYYIIKEGFDRILIAQGLSNVVEQNDWRTKIVERFSKDEIQSIKMLLPDDSYILNKKNDGQWYIDDQEVNEQIINQLLGNLEVIPATDFPPADFIFQDTGFLIEIQNASSTKKLIFGQKANNLNSIKNSTGLVFLIDAGIKTRITTGRADFFIKNTPGTKKSAP